MRMVRRGIVRVVPALHAPFYLQGGVIDAETMIQFMHGGIDERVVIFTVGSDQMRSEGNLSRADGKETPGGHRDRKNLSIKLSYDEAQSWPVNKVLEPGASAYSDLAVLPDGTILCFYERPKKLTLARLNLEWLTDGKDSLPRK